jgi:hypothetical protein
MTRHAIRINQVAAGRYAVTGSGISIAATTTPIIDAALALRESGYPEADSIIVTCGGVSVLPASIGAVLKPRITSHRNDLMREMMGFDRR